MYSLTGTDGCNEVIMEDVHNLVLKVLPEIEDADSKQRTTIVAVLKYLRPYFEQAVAKHAPKTARAVEDRRLKLWRAYVVVYESDVTVYTSPGRRLDTNGNWYEFGGEVHQGLDAFAMWLTRLMLSLSASEDDFKYAKMERYVHGLRPTLSRENGFCKLNRASRDGRFYISGGLIREEEYQLRLRERAESLRRPLTRD